MILAASFHVSMQPRLSSSCFLSLVMLLSQSSAVKSLGGIRCPIFTLFFFYVCERSTETGHPHGPHPCKQMRVCLSSQPVKIKWAVMQANGAASEDQSEQPGAQEAAQPDTAAQEQMDVDAPQAQQPGS